MTHEPNALLPCPFCGGKAQIMRHFVSGELLVKCAKCASCSDHFFRKEDAPAIWNTRHPVQQVPACDGLREVVEKTHIPAEIKSELLECHNGGHTVSASLIRKTLMCISQLENGLRQISDYEHGFCTSPQDLKRIADKALTQPAASEPSAEVKPTFTAKYLWEKAQWYADDFERMMKAMGEGNRNHALRDLAHSIMMDTMKNVDMQQATALHAARLEGVKAQWQPIETAPKDGTEIIVNLQYGVGMVMVSWEDGRWVTGGGVVYHGDSSFTHWMPLPAAPEQVIKESKDRGVY